VAAVIAATAMPAVGCGSSGSSRADLAAKANPVCARVVTELDYYSKLKPSNSRDLVSRVAVARAAPLIAAVELAAQADLSRLRPPSSLATDWHRLVAAMGGLGQTTRRLGDLANPSGLTSAIASGEADLREMRSIAARDGIGECARIGHPD
jgi:hypothetical protein